MQVRNKSSGTPDDSGLLQESVSSHPSSLTAQPAELYYSDIADTKNSIRPFASYKANLHISVDNVRHAPETDINILDESDTESDLSGDDSLTDSSCNDVELDSNDINFTTKKIKSSSSSIDCRSPAVHVFQPLSKHEVFIDDSPQKHSAKSSSKVNDNNTNKNGNTCAVFKKTERFHLSQIYKVGIFVSSCFWFEDIENPFFTKITPSKSSAKVCTSATDVNDNHSMLWLTLITIM